MPEPKAKKATKKAAPKKQKSTDDKAADILDSLVKLRQESLTQGSNELEAALKRAERELRLAGVGE